MLRRLSLLALVAAGAGLAVWVTAVAAMSSRGLDLSDESFYLLSYRWWDQTPRMFTAVQYLYGPVLQLFGWSVPGLRLFRLVSILAAHLAFGCALIGWLRARHPERSGDRLGDAAAVSAITLSGAVTYGWLPLSPGYNDVTVLFSLVLVAALLRAMRAAVLGRRLPLPTAVGAGVGVAALLAAKWSAAVLLLGFLVVLGVAVLRALGAVGWIRFTVAGAIGFLVPTGAFLVFAGGFSTIATIAEVNRLAAAHSNSPGSLVAMYITSWSSELGLGLERCVPALVVLAVAWVVGRRRHGPGGVITALAPVAVVLVAYPHRFGIARGGSAEVETYASVLFGLGLLVVASVVRRRPGRSRPSLRSPESLLAVVLFAVPVVQAFGTANPLYVLAINAFGLWCGLMVVGVRTLRAGSGRWAFAASATVCAVIVAFGAGISGLVEHPYLAASMNEADTPIGGHGMVAGLRVSAPVAAQVNAVERAVGPIAPGTPVMAFDEMAGFVLAVNGRSVGEAWYSAADHSRAIVGIRDACRDGSPFKGVRPVVLFNRLPEDADLLALRLCGVDLAADYETIRVPGKPLPILVYRPRTDPTPRGQ